MTGAQPARIGLIVPSSNIALEQELAGLRLPTAEATMHVSRVRVTEISSESDDQFAAVPMNAAADLLADVGLDLLVWAGTAGLWLGVDHDEKLIRGLAESTGVPATTTTLALLAACRALDVNRIALVTPYVDSVVDRIVDTCARQGIAVVSERHLGITRNQEFGLVGPDAIRQMAHECASTEAEALVIACTNLRATPLIADLQQEMRMPVLDSIAVTFWHALECAGVAHPGTPQYPGAS
jgi:maleate isomerase